MGGFQKNNLFGLIFKKQPIWVDFFQIFYVSLHPN